MKKLLLKPGRMTHQQLVLIAIGEVSISLEKKAIKAIKASERTVARVLLSGETVYGINTGFGSLANTRIADEELSQLQRNLILSHACGVGKYLTDDVVRLILVLKINNLAQGFSGVRLELVEFLITLFNADFESSILS